MNQARSSERTTIFAVMGGLILAKRCFGHSRVSDHWHEQQSDLEETSFFSLVCHGATPSGTPHTHIDPSLLCKEHFLVDESPRFPLYLRFQLTFPLRPLSTLVDRSADFRETRVIYPTAFQTMTVPLKFDMSRVCIEPVRCTFHGSTSLNVRRNV